MLQGEVAFITGAGRGIGAQTAKALSERGARVAVTARRLRDAEAVVRGLDGDALGLSCDVADQASIIAALRDTEMRLGRVTILINNAGVIQPIGHLHETDPAAWGAAITVVLVGAAAAARAVLPAMIAAGRGTIVNLSSGAAHRPLEGWSAYCAAKAGLAMLTRSIALEYGARGVRAFGFAPGLVDTEMQAEIRASGLNPVSALPREALTSASAPAQAIAYLCSRDADDLSGGEVDIRNPAFRDRSGLTTLAD